jgi:hypothetical protein
MKRIGFAKYSCTKCSFHFFEYFGAPVILADGKEALSNHQFCVSCKQVTKGFYPNIKLEDPKLWNAMTGNTGRILRHLISNGAALFANWSKDWNLPSPAKIRNVCTSLLALDLVEITDLGIDLTEGGKTRMQNYLYKPPCSICGTTYEWLGGMQCPSCVDGILGDLERGSGSVKMLEES